MPFVFSILNPFFSILLVLCFIAFFLIFLQCRDPQVRVRGMEGVGEVEAKSHAFLTSALDGNGRLTSRSLCFSCRYPLDRAQKCSWYDGVERSTWSYLSSEPEISACSQPHSLPELSRPTNNIMYTSYTFHETWMCRPIGIVWGLIKCTMIQVFL
jgi:hypothetical protein